MRDRCCYAKSNYFSFLLVTALFCGGVSFLAKPCLALPIASPLAQADSAETETPDTPKTALNVGDRGPDVRALQEQLKTLGDFEGEVDGDYGGKTQAAVAKFQEREGLDADGVAGLSTLERLDTVLADRKAKTEAQDAEKAKKKDASQSRSRRKFLLLIFAGSFLTLSVVGSGLFLLLRAFNRAMQPPDEAFSLEAEEEQEGKRPAPPDLSVEANQTPPPPLAKPLEPVEPPKAKLIEKPVENSHLSPAETLQLAGNDEPLSFWETELPKNGSTVEMPASGNLPLSREVPQTDESPVTVPEPKSQQQAPNEALALPPAPQLPKLDLIEQLIEDLQETQPEKRRKAIWELAQRADSRAVQPLIGLLIDSDSQQRGLILEALSQIGTRTLKPMNRALTIALQDENAQVRKNAIRDLTQMYELMGKLSKLLYLAIDDPDPEVQDTAKWALNQLNSLQMNWGDRANSDS